MKYSDEYKGCTLCPRECGADRTCGVGVCGQGHELVVARAALHAWEEPCISGERGSGTVFFSGCSLGCVYCQNHKISSSQVGKTISVDRLVDIFFELEGKGAHNINLVTPSHFLPSVREAMEIARSRNFNLPFVYNTSGYEKAQSLHTLSGLVDVYLPDFKYADPTVAEKYSNARDYPECAMAALAEMVAQQPKPQFDSDGMMTKGVIVRHLMLPCEYENSRRVIEYLAKTYSDKIYVSIMSQYTPVQKNEQYPNLNERVKRSQYERLIRYATHLGIENGFIQDGQSAEESFIPDFDLLGV